MIKIKVGGTGSGGSYTAVKKIIDCFEAQQEFEFVEGVENETFFKALVPELYEKIFSRKCPFCVAGVCISRCVK